MLNPEERLIVQATGPDASRPRWVTAPRLYGCRTFGPRDSAEMFLCWDAAEKAIHEIQRSASCADIEFEVQCVEPAKCLWAAH